MHTYEIRNFETNEVVDTADSYLDALGVAEYLSSTTKTLHYVPVRSGRKFDYAV